MENKLFRLIREGEKNTHRRSCKKQCNSTKTGTWAVNAGALSRLLLRFFFSSCFFTLIFFVSLCFFCTVSAGFSTRNYSYRCVVVCVCNKTDLNLLIWQTCLDFSHVGSLTTNTRIDDIHTRCARSTFGIRFTSPLILRIQFRSYKSFVYLLVRSLILFHSIFFPVPPYSFLSLFGRAAVVVVVLSATLLILWSVLFVPHICGSMLCYMHVSACVCVCVLNIFRSCHLCLRWYIWIAPVLLLNDLKIINNGNNNNLNNNVNHACMKRIL